MGEQVWEKPALWNASKLQIPKEAFWWLRREKLLASMESGDEGAVVFHAGAGYGKTTVMAEWARSHRAQSCWYRLHESDNHFYRFLYGIATALSGVMHANFFDAGNMKLTGREKPEQVSELFFSRCIPALPEDGFVICLDDFQMIHDETVQEFLLRFIEYGEGRARFFFSLRGSFPGFLAACLMRGEVREVREDELRFEERETALLLQKMSGRELPEKTVREIHQDTNGWPAGIAFAGLDLKEARVLDMQTTFSVPAKRNAYAAQTVHTAAFDRTRLYDYIFYEIFRKLAYDTQKFLTESSALEIMTPPLCDYALGRGDAAGMLRYLVRENLFISCVEETCGAYGYDGIFRDFLRSRLPVGRRREILLRAAEYEVRRGAWEPAVDYGMQCGEKGCALVAAVFEKQAVGMTDLGQRALLRVWIDYLYDFREKLSDTALYCMYEQLYRDGERQRGRELLLAAAKQARAKLRYDSYECYMREFAALEENAQGRGAAGSERDGAAGSERGDAAGSERGGAAESERGGAAESERDGAAGSERGGAAESERDGAAGSERDSAAESERDGAAESERGSAAESESSGAKQEKGMAVSETVLFVQCMSFLSVRGAGREAAWRTKKTKELFACLFYERGRWVAREVLTERLWPEKEAGKSAVLFHTTASYLRKALAGVGGADCLLVKNQSYALNMTRMKSDIGELDECYACLKSGKTLSSERAAGLGALYGRGYLYEEDYLWIGAYGEEVGQRYQWMMKTLAEGAFAEKKYEDAASYLKRALEADGYALAVLERLVECLLLCRDMTGAKRMYERLREVSLEMIGEEPARAFEDYSRGR